MHGLKNQLFKNKRIMILVKSNFITYKNYKKNILYEVTMKYILFKILILNSLELILKFF